MVISITNDGIFVSFSVSETTCTESLMNGFEDGAVGGEVGLFVEDESTGLNWLFGVEHLDVSN